MAAPWELNLPILPAQVNVLSFAEIADFQSVIDWC